MKISIPETEVFKNQRIVIHVNGYFVLVELLRTF